MLALSGRSSSLCPGSREGTEGLGWPPHLLSQHSQALAFVQRSGKDAGFCSQRALRSSPHSEQEGTAGCPQLAWNGDSCSTVRSHGLNPLSVWTLPTAAWARSPPSLSPQGIAMGGEADGPVRGWGQWTACAVTGI